MVEAADLIESVATLEMSFPPSSRSKLADIVHSQFKTLDWNKKKRREGNERFGLNHADDGEGLRKKDETQKEIK